MRRRWVRQWAFRGIALACGGVVAAIIAEVALRLVGVSFPLPYVPDPHTGSRLRAGFAAEFSKEGRARVRITSDGRRDRERPVPKPAGTFRIAVLGDSYAEALQVDQDQTFWAVLESQLNDCPRFAGQTVEVLNFGVSGFGTAQELEMLRNYVWPYQPDLVLLAFLTGNDVSDNSQMLSADGVRPYYRLRDNDLELDRSFQNHPYYRDALSPYFRFKVALINRCRLLQVGRQVWAEWRQRGGRPQVPELEAGLDPVYVEPADDDWREAWEITERLLKRVHEQVTSHGAELLVVTLSNGVQVHPDPDLRARVEARWHVPDLFYPDRRVEAFCERQQIPVLVLAPRLQQYAQDQQRFLHGFKNTRLGTGHWNDDGHRLAGLWIAETICAAREEPRSAGESAAPDDAGQGPTQRQ